METSNPLLQRDIDYSATEATGSMTLNGTIHKSGILLLLCIAAAVFSFTANPQIQIPLGILGLIGGLVACLVGTFMPKTAPIAAPAYALLEGLILGVISAFYEHSFRGSPGLVANAMLLTFCVLGLMLFLYATRIIRVTERMMMGIVIATGSVALVYFVDIIFGMFGHPIGFIHDSGPVGIIVSLVIVGIAAFNLLMDFAIIETNVQQGAPKYMEWYCGMALLVTLVWLYLEILRLLAKLQKR